METLFGMKIVPNSYIPVDESVYRLAPGGYIGEEFRARMQAWCDEFFGRQEVAYIIQAGAFGYDAHGEVVVMHPENILKLKMRTGVNARYTTTSQCGVSEEKP